MGIIEMLKSEVEKHEGFPSVVYRGRKMQWLDTKKWIVCDANKRHVIFYRGIDEGLAVETLISGVKQSE